MTSNFSKMTSLSIFFNVVLFLSSSLVTGLSFMSISSLVMELWQFTFIRDWPEIRKSEIPPFCLNLPNIWRLEQVRNTKLGTKVCNKTLLNAAKCQGYSFYHFWVIKRKQTEGVKLLPTPRLGLILCALKKKYLKKIIVVKDCRNQPDWQKNCLIKKN